MCLSVAIGTVYSLGRADYDMLGLGEEVQTEKNTPAPILGLPKALSISCGEWVGYAVTADGQVFAWGMDSSFQLGTENGEDAWNPVQMTGDQLKNHILL